MGEFSSIIIWNLTDNASLLVKKNKIRVSLCKYDFDGKTNQKDFNPV